MRGARPPSRPPPRRAHPAPPRPAPQAALRDYLNSDKGAIFLGPMPLYVLGASAGPSVGGGADHGAVEEVDAPPPPKAKPRPKRPKAAKGRRSLLALDAAHDGWGALTAHVLGASQSLALPLRARAGMRGGLGGVSRVALPSRRVLLSATPYYLNNVSTPLGTTFGSNSLLAVNGGTTVVIGNAPPSDLLNAENAAAAYLAYLRVGPKERCRAGGSAARGPGDRCGHCIMSMRLYAEA